MNIIQSYIYSLFTDHPKSKKMTYLEHMSGALTYSIYSLSASACFIVHAFFPFVFECNGSELIKNLHEKLESHNEICDK